MSSKSTLYISYDGMTDSLGQSQVLPYLCGLSKRGYLITLLSCEKPERFEQFKPTIESICIEANINWQPIMYHAKPPIISTLKDIKNLYELAYSLHHQYQFSIVHCRSYIAALVGLSMKEKFGTKFLFDMRGFWADERVDGNLWRLSNPMYKIIYNYFKKKEKVFLIEADHIISLTNAAKSEINSWSLTPKSLPITVIPCCVDTTLFSTENVTHQQQDELRSALALKQSDFVIGYVGSIGTWYLLDEMLDYFKTMLQKQKSIFLFITNEPASMILEEAQKKNIPKEVFVIRSVARKEVPLYISIMNYSLFFIKPSFSKMASSPTKQGEIMAMGKPVVCNARVGDTEFVVNQYQSGVVVSDFKTVDFDCAINAINKQTFDAATIRRGAIEFYGLDKGIALYAGIYDQLSSTK